MKIKKYIGVKLIEAEPMTRGEYNIFRNWTLPADENPNDEGYKLFRQDGTYSWEPKELFENSYMSLGDPEGTKIVEEDVNNFVVCQEAIKWGEKTTVLHVTLKNGFIITESSSCVDPANFDMVIGANICTDKIKDKIWGYLGFLLQCAKGGMR